MGDLKVHDADGKSVREPSRAPRRIQLFVFEWVPKSNPPSIFPPAARKLLGFNSLRPGQREAIQSLLQKRDTLLVQPAGSGKSAVYRIAASLLPGPAVIVSPLIALQKDRVESIEAGKLEEGAVVNSALSAGEPQETLDPIQDGEVEFIFLAPEQLRKPGTLNRLRAAGVSLFVIDEAHCISQWGHDFRPDYLELAQVIETLGHPTLLAMTAAASKEVRDEIAGRLGMRDPRVIVHGFDRPNISLRVDLFRQQDEKIEALLKRVEFADKSGIVYVATHKHAGMLVAQLKQRSVDAVFYHGGLKAKDRGEIQDRFMTGNVPVIVATSAFGMEVDKPDIRFVYHAHVGESLDAYYRELGQAGRDGEPAEAVLFYRPGDISAQRFKTGAGHVNAADLQAFADALHSHRDAASLRQLCLSTSLSERRILTIAHQLETIGVAKEINTGKIGLIRKKTPAEMVEAASEQQGFLKEIGRRRLEQMRRYAEARNCRREFLLRYFGDDFAGPCGNCDRCESNGAIAAAG
ncbi:MAG: RecQ family ATP-dependent DNA helicase [Terracidiphilus sp.]